MASKNKTSVIVFTHRTSHKHRLSTVIVSGCLFSDRAQCCYCSLISIDTLFALFAIDYCAVSHVKVVFQICSKQHCHLLLNTWMGISHSYNFSHFQQSKKGQPTFKTLSAFIHVLKKSFECEERLYSFWSQIWGKTQNVSRVKYWSVLWSLTLHFNMI